MFGTKKILAKIINGKLVIRVGGGYMNAEEFIRQYGWLEMVKIKKMEEESGGFVTTPAEPSAKSKGTGAKIDTNVKGAIAARRGTMH